MKCERCNAEFEHKDWETGRIKCFYLADYIRIWICEECIGAIINNWHSSEDLKRP